jgi:hypothetical protein
MSNRDLLLMASILALLRGEMTVRGVAERFGVTEAQVARWRDIFEIAGMLALSNLLSGQSGGPRAKRRKARRSGRARNDFGEPTTAPLSYTTTTTPPLSYTTTPQPATTATELQSGGKARSKSKTKKRNKRAKSKRKR